MAGTLDDGWNELTDGASRLIWARSRWQVKAGAIAGSATHAAESLGMQPGTYRAYERQPGSSKHIALDHQSAIKFGRRFGVSWQWLLLGAGTPFDDQLPIAQERALTAMREMGEEQQEAVATMLEQFARRQAS